MRFKDMVAEDIRNVFLNLDAFAEKRTIRYGYDSGEYAEEYRDIPVVLSGLKEQDRRQMISTGEPISISDHTQGLYMVSTILHCAREDLGGNQPEKGQRISINDEEGGGFFREFYVASSTCEQGMLRIELEAIDE